MALRLRGSSRPVTPILKLKDESFTPSAENFALSRGRPGDDPTHDELSRHAKEDVRLGS